MKGFRNFVLLVLLILSPLSAKAKVVTAQDSLLFRFNTFASWCSPEKVYLHYDRSCYIAGETIWFKGRVQEASSRSILPPSKFLYVEVLDESAEAVVRVKIKRTKDGFPGCIDLPDILETGDYTIRGYTLWQLNNDYEYLFNDKIRIIGGKKKEVKKPETSTSDLDISFWPEGGRYFVNQKAVIGFKVVDARGRSVDFEGLLVSDKDGAYKHVVTTHDGMGVFSFIPKGGHSYSVKDASGKLHPLPPPSEDGATLQLLRRSDRYFISAVGYGGGESASLLLRDCSELRLLAQISMDGSMGALMMDQSFFRPGINHFLLVDSRGLILSERLFFVRDNDAPLCELDRDSFTISLNNPDGKPLDGSCSVSVVRGALKDWQQSDGIVSYMGLSSELKGRLNNPYYYFSPEVPLKDRDSALDILMIIQGWRYYDIDHIDRIKHKRELAQELHGHVARRHSSKIPRDFTFTFMIPKKHIWNSLEVKRGRLFIIDSLDFEENTKMLINIGTSRFGAHYIPKWDGDTFAETYVYNPAPGYSDEVLASVPFENDDSNEILQAAVVTASYGDDDVLVFGKNYREDLVIFKDMTLVEYLSMTKAMFEYDGENMYNRNRRRNRNSFDDDSEDSMNIIDDDNDSGKVKLIVEDAEQEWWSYDMLRLEDLRALSISTRPDPIYGGDGGVVHISIKPGGLRRDEEHSPSLLYFVPLGYQVPRYFEPSRSEKTYNGQEEVRNTIWWAPDVAIDGGQAKIEFSGGDPAESPYIVRIEGLSADGRPFSRHCTI